MADFDKILSVPSNGTDPAALMAMMNNNNGMNNPLAWIVFLALIQNGGFGGFGGNRGGAMNGILDMETQNKLNALQTQLNDSQNSNYLREAIQGNGFALSQLAQNLNVSNTSLLSAINGVQAAIGQLGAQNGMSALQIVNAIQSGDASLSRQLCECCCENRLLTTQQGYENRIQTIEQTNLLGSQADRNTRSITDAIAAQTTAMTKEFCELKERELQAKIDSLTADNALLRSNAAVSAQTQQFAAMLAPINAELAAIKAAQPATITLPNTQYTVVPSLYATAATDFVASYWANRLTGATTPATTTPATGA